MPEPAQRQPARGRGGGGDIWTTVQNTRKPLYNRARAEADNRPPLLYSYAPQGVRSSTIMGIVRAGFPLTLPYAKPSASSWPPNTAEYLILSVLHGLPLFQIYHSYRLSGKRSSRIPISRHIEESIFNISLRVKLNHSSISLSQKQ